jgi:hypothetical protein
MDVQRHEATLRAVQKPPAKPWRSATGAGAAPPPKVYRVEPREFRDLVQRLTGAPPTTVARHHQTTPVRVQPVPVLATAAGEDHQQQQLYAPSWLSFPMTGMDAHRHGNDGALM